MSDPLRVLASQAGFAWGDLVVTNYDNACFRSIVWKQHNYDVRFEIDPINAAVGAHHEDQHAVRLAKDNPVQLWEIPIRNEMVSGVLYSGRCDFIVGDDAIHETKGSVSKNNLLYVIKKGQWKSGWLAQLTSYFWQFGIFKGSIVAGSYLQVEDGFKELGVREFKVEVAKDGRLTVDGKDTAFSVQDNIAHLTKSAVLVGERKIHPHRPLGWDKKFGSPCTYCCFAPLCDKVDNKAISDDETFVVARQLLGEKK